jgi:hypothetical protein
VGAMQEGCGFSLEVWASVVTGLSRIVAAVKAHPMTRCSILSRIRDLAALEEAKRMDLALPGLALANQLYVALIQTIPPPKMTRCCIQDLRKGTTLTVVSA